MFKPFHARYALSATLIFGAVSPALTEAATPDSTLYTTYTVSTNLQSANWIVCGSTTETDGCYGFGSLGSFGLIGAMLEGQPVVTGNTVTRDIYVLDIASGSSANGVTLNVYTKTDVVSATDDQVTVTPSQTIALPLVGGSTATASMAANGSYLFVGTNQSTQVVRIQKGQWAVTSFGSGSPPTPVASITANINGYVTVTFGATGGQFSSFYIFDPTTGGVTEDGGGPNFTLNDMNSVVPVALPF